VRGLAWHRCTGSEQRGFALLEVMVALVLVGALLGALATEAQRALDAAIRLRGKAASLSPEHEADLDLGAWDWGQRVAFAEWGTGPVLRVSGGTGLATGAKLGVWCRGWFLGEWEVPTTGPTVLGQDVWQGHIGEELVLRTRTEAESWGPPWRSVVPDPYSRDTSDLALAGSGPVEAQSYEAARTVVHLLCRSTCTPQVSWSSEPLVENLAGALVLLSECGQGLCRVSIGERTQSWLGVEGRRIDVYF
jgi:prepilin-type N-terminal cleavage/methylation domain-containing protein